MECTFWEDKHSSEEKQQKNAGFPCVEHRMHTALIKLCDTGLAECLQYFTQTVHLIDKKHK